MLHMRRLNSIKIAAHSSIFVIDCIFYPVSTRLLGWRQIVTLNVVLSPIEKLGDSM